MSGFETPLEKARRRWQEWQDTADRRGEILKLAKDQLADYHAARTQAVCDFHSKIATRDCRTATLYRSVEEELRP